MTVLTRQSEQALRLAMREQGLPERYLDSLRRCYLPLAEVIAQKKKGLGRLLEVSINGPQGSGKSTLTRFLGLLLEAEHGLRVVALSLDDFYRTRAGRRQLARDIHPLFATRGVPGTHDANLAIETFEALRAADFRPVRLPRFDKATDDRLPPAQWGRVEEAPDVLLFEGWCNHCPPQRPEELAEPVNPLEREEDPAGIWRRAVNDFLVDYHRGLFRPVDLLVYLRIPGFEQVLEWRGLQERKLRQRQGADAGMSAAQLERFIQHYERLTRQGMATLPDLADAVIDLDAAHQAVALLLKRA
jgi:D-glycerate 3-kinase